MVFATKEMLDEMHEKTKRDFDANPEKYLRRYKRLLITALGLCVAILLWTAARVIF